MERTVSRRRVLAASGALATAGLAGCTVQGREAEESVSREYDADAVSLETIRGSVSITSAETETVEISGTKKAADDGDLDNVELNTTNSDGLSVSVDVDGSYLLSPTPKVDLEVTVPHSVPAVESETTNGDITATDLQSDLTAETTNGEIRTLGHRGQVSATSTNGDIDLALVEADSVGAETTNGDVDVNVPSATYDLDLETTNGGQDVSGIDTGTGGETYPIDVETTNGDIEIRGL